LDAHPPVAEPVDRDGPESLLEDRPAVVAEVLAQQREEADPRRVHVPVASAERDRRGVAGGPGLDPFGVGPAHRFTGKKL